MRSATYLLLLATAFGCDQKAMNQQLIDNSKQLQSQIENQVALDAAKQYDIVRRNAKSGDQQSEIQLHVQAGFVAAAYLQANEEERYKAWNDIAEEHARRAGMR